jgi:hypothetical protein
MTCSAGGGNPPRGLPTTIVKQAEILLGLRSAGRRFHADGLRTMSSPPPRPPLRNHSVLMALRDTTGSALFPLYRQSLACLEDLGLARLFESVIDSAILGRRRLIRKSSAGPLPHSTPTPEPAG